LLLAAAGRLLAAGIHIELLFVGDGVLRSSLERQVDNEGLRRHVHFLGLRSPAEIAGLLHASDCFALSSAYEGMPMALLEALGTGTPVVTTRVGEVARVIKEGTNGHISPDRSPEALASSLLRVRDHALNYSSENCVESVKNFFPAQVLTPIYANYRALGTSSQRSQNSQSHRSAQWN
jgi:glycosyltransferase involved in cell wall biosynthesis